MNFLARARLRNRTPPRADVGSPPGTGLTPSAVQRGLRLSVIEGALSNIHVSITRNIQLCQQIVNVAAICTRIELP